MHDSLIFSPLLADDVLHLLCTAFTGVNIVQVQYSHPLQLYLHTSAVEVSAALTQIPDKGINRTLF